jgi:hypothetical protein
MVLQSVTAPVLMFFVAHVDRAAWGAGLGWIKTALVWLTVVATTFSMLPYLLQSKAIFDEADPA